MRFNDGPRMLTGPASNACRAVGSSGSALTGIRWRMRRKCAQKRFWPKANPVFLRNDLSHPCPEFVTAVQLELHLLVSVKAVNRQRRDIFSQPLKHVANRLPDP